MTVRDPRDELPEHLPALRAFAMSLTRSSAAADDLVQDTIVKAWSNIDRFQAGTNLRAWLFTILRNTFFSEKRKRKREVADVDGKYAATLSEKPSHDARLAFGDFLTAFTAAFSCINNIGPGLQEVGPATNFSSRKDFLKPPSP